MKILACMTSGCPPAIPTLDAVEKSEKKQLKKNRGSRRTGDAMLGFVAGLQDLRDEAARA